MQAVEAEGDRTATATEVGASRRGRPHGRVVVLSGPSAVGKSTVVRCLRERIPDLHFSVSATTRAPRPGEVDGVDYHFVSAGSLSAADRRRRAAGMGGDPRRSAPLGHPGRAGPRRRRRRTAGADRGRSGRRPRGQAAMPEAITVFLAPPSWEALGGPAGRSRDRDTRGDGAPAGHRTRRIGRPERLRRGRREQPIGDCVRRIGILAGGQRAGHGVTANPDSIQPSSRTPL